MSYDLSGRGGRFNWNIEVWPELLKLAQLYGWQPAGTELDVVIERARRGSRQRDEPFDDPADEAEMQREMGEWSGTYFSNDFQIVADEDARSLADALERALPDIPDHDALAGKQKILVGPGNHIKKLQQCHSPHESALLVTCWHRDGTETAIKNVNRMEYFSGQRRDYLKAFIDFCHAGEFRIA